MIVVPFSKDENVKVDPITKSVVFGVRSKIGEYDDDFMVLCCGSTGTGKSVLMLHTAELYDSENCSVDFIGLDRKSFAHALKISSEKKDRRFCGNDEANVSKRDAMSAYNKDLIDLYMANRGMNTFHWWNNPSLEMIDKAFIKERIKGVIFIFTKSKVHPRQFYYFHGKDILRMWEKKKLKSLDLKVLKKFGKEFAFYQGWFRDYDGKLKADYLVKKGARMSTKVDDFYDKYGADDLLMKTEVAKRLSIGTTTLYRYIDTLEGEGTLVEDVDFVVKPGGRTYFKKCSLIKFEELIKRNKETSKNNSKFGDGSMNGMNDNPLSPYKHVRV